MCGAGLTPLLLVDQFANAAFLPMHPVAQSIVTALAAHADSARAEGMVAYMRGQFAFFGIQTPVRRALTRPFIREVRPADELFAIAADLWAQPERECQYVGSDLLARQWRALGASHVPAVIELARGKAWWDTVDALAGVVGDVLRPVPAEAARQMDAAVAHPDKWVRRIAMLHQLGWRGDTDLARLFGYALRLAPEPDFFIRKAIGWALRDYARHDPAAVRDFLARHAGVLSPLTRREAGKHLPRG